MNQSEMPLDASPFLEACLDAEQDFASLYGFSVFESLDFMLMYYSL